MIKRLIFAAVLSLISMGSAFAACTNPLPITNGSGGTVNMSVSTNADGNCQYNVSAGLASGVPDLSSTFSLTSSTQSTALAIAGTQSVQFNLTGTFSATVTGQVSNDNANWVNVPLFNMTTGAWIAPGTGATAVGNYMLAGSQGAGWARINVTYTSGTVAGTMRATTQGPSATWGDYLNWLALTGASTCLAGTNPTTNSAITSGQVGSINCGLHGAPYADAQQVAGVASVNGGVPVVNGGSTYNTVAASQSTQALTGGAGGATGDYLSHCVVQPTTTAAGTVMIFDNSTTVYTFTTGTLSNLVPFAIPVGAYSVNGAWKVTTGANETVTCVGKFH